MKADGVQGYHPGTYGNHQSAYNIRMDIDSPVEIDMMASGGEGGILVTVTVNSADEALEGNYKLRCALVETYTFWNGASNGQTDWHHDLLHFSPSPTGIDFEIGTNETVEETFDFDWYANMYEDDNLTILAWVQNDSNDEVIQSEQIEFVAGYSFALDAPSTAGLVSAGTAKEFPYTIVNAGQEDDSYTVTVDTDLPEGWSFTYTTPDGEHSGNSTFDLAAQANFEGVVDVVTSDVPGNQGEVSLTYASVNEPALVYTLSFYVNAAGDVFLWNLDPEAAYTDYFTDALDNMNEPAMFSYSSWNEVNYELNIADVNDSDISVIMMFTGDGGEVPDAAFEQLETFLDNGGSVFASGSDMPRRLRNTDLMGYFGAQYQQNYPSGHEVSGVEGSIFDGLTFDTQDGDGADNLGTPCSLLNDGTGEYCLVFNAVRRTGVQNETDTHKTILFGFPFEAISTQGMRDQVMAAVMGFLFTTDAEEITPGEVPSEFSLGQNYPNPFNPSTGISFNLPEVSNVTLAVFDVTGREVARLAQGSYSAGTHQVTWNAQDMASGIYFYRLEASNFTATRKMVLVK